ncbi:MAG: relaxase/mobilization nuclease domain-containing protein [Bacteroidota bacterium]
MIIKVSSRKKPSFYQLLTYMFYDKGNRPNPETDSFVIAHNVKGNSIEAWARSFEENEQYRKRKRVNSVVLFHEILSWHSADRSHLTLEKMEDMTRKYIELRNPHGLYVAIAHVHNENPHVHICSSGVEYRSGKSMRISRKEFRDLKQSIETYQKEKYPEITYSKVLHSKVRSGKSFSDGEYYIKQRSPGKSIKEYLKKKIDECLQSTDSLLEFLNSLTKDGAEPYYRNGKPTGIRFKGRKHRFRQLGVDPSKLEQFLSWNSKNQLNKKEKEVPKKSLASRDDLLE